MTVKFPMYNKTALFLTKRAVVVEHADSFEDMPPGLHPTPNRNPA